MQAALGCGCLVKAPKVAGSTWSRLTPVTATAVAALLPPQQQSEPHGHGSCRKMPTFDGIGALVHAAGLKFCMLSVTYQLPLAASRGHYSFALIGR